VKFEPSTVVAENCNDFLFLSTLSAVTTTSLNSAVETFNVTVISVLPLTEISCGANPTEEMMSFSTPDGILIEKTPSEFVRVFTLEFLAVTVAPTIGCLPASVTLPVTVRSWAKAVGAPATSKNNRSENKCSCFIIAYLTGKKNGIGNT